MTTTTTDAFTRRGFVLLAELLDEHPQLQGREPPPMVRVTVDDKPVDLSLAEARLPSHGCVVLYYHLPPAGPSPAEVEHAWLWRLLGPRISSERKLQAELEEERERRVVAENNRDIDNAAHLVAMDKAAETIYQQQLELTELRAKIDVSAAAVERIRSGLERIRDAATACGRGVISAAVVASAAREMLE